MPKKKILLFGAAGQLGLAWQSYSRELGTPDSEVISYNSARLDITRYNQVEKEIASHQPDVLINCAAYTKVDKAEDEREKARIVNAEAVKHIAQYCRKYDTKLIHFSTDYIFAGLREDRARFPHGYPEDHPADPVNWYGQTKWEGEQAVRNSGCRYLLIRISWLCGLYGSNFIKTMIRLTENNSSIKVVEDQFGSPAFAREVVKNTGLLMEEKVEGTYHLSSGGILSWADFAEAIFEHIDKDINVQRIPSSAYPTKAARPFYSKLDTRKIQQIGNIKIDNWKTGLKRFLKQLENKK
jgi:dTDP-4-dehydrorhamnose reductase